MATVQEILINMNIIMGLDISTSCTALCVLQSSSEFFDVQNHLLHFEAITFKDANFWEKCDKVKSVLEQISLSFKVDSFFVEAPMKRFAVGFSSAETISILQRYNGIVCYTARDIWKVDPTYINVCSARKAVGVHVQSKAKAAGKNGKQQTFDHIVANDFAHVKLPMKKSGNYREEAKDIVDAYVVARAGMILAL